MPGSKPPPFPPRDENELDPRLKTTARSGGKKDLLELIDPSKSPVSKRQTLPVSAPIDPAPIPAEPVPTRPSVDNLGETKPPPTRRALGRQPTNSGLGYGVPSPSFGGDTDFDAGGDDGPLANLRRTSSFERGEVPLPSLTLSEPPGRDTLDLG